MFKFLSKLFDSNEKQLNKYRPLVEEINQLEKDIKKLSDEDLEQATQKFRDKLGVDVETARDERGAFEPPIPEEDKTKQREEEKAKLMEIMPEAYAYVREASKRLTQHRHYDVQVLAGIFLAKEYVAEQFTGEGKTLSAIMPLFLYALMGKSAHLVTVNDYLARRDGEWSGHIFHSLGMSVGVINPGASYKFVTDEEAIELKGDEAREGIKKRKKESKESGRLLLSSMDGINLVQCSKKEAYACDVVYGTNNEFGFDYLRDNMAISLEQKVQSPLYFSIVDEADSILIDESRTPLIISSPAEDTNELYNRFASVAKQLDSATDYIVDEKANSVSLTDEGVDKAENILNVDNIWENYSYVHHLDNALKAKELYEKDDEYIIKDDQVMIVDQFTGRVLPGRRYSEGLHQAIEAKEGVAIKKESRTLATITFQNYFRLYDFMAGMTATAITEAEEFAEIYGLEVIVIPTNEPVIRKDHADVVYRTQVGKFRAVVEDVKQKFEEGRPVLVGTTSVENSELLSEMLKKEGVPHNVLNAKQHEKEARIVSEAGKKSQVTIATNMAGRGTDISLGEGVVDLGGLYVLGTERHESRRIDNQLRGRSGRQGDPGSSRFYVSLEDDLMRIFGGEAIKGLFARVGMTDDMPIESGIIGRSIESAQKKVESHNFDIRKHLVEYDDVLSQQREIIYDLRKKILTILDEKKEEIKNEKDKYDFDKLDVDLALKIREQLEDFSIKEPETWDVNFGIEDKLLKQPLRLWILKMSLQHVEFIVGAQLKDDAKIDDLEEQKVLAGVLDVVPVDLAQVAAKELGYKDWDSFAVKFYSDEFEKDRKKEILRLVIAAYIIHTKNLGDQVVSEVERRLILQTLDNMWVEHLDQMTDLRHGISLRSYAQKDPLVEYKNEGFAMFDRMLAQMEENIVKRFFKVRLVKKSDTQDLQKAEAKKESPTPKIKASSNSQDSRPGKVSKNKTVVKKKSVGRNDPCPCGSGKKYKKCCYPKYE